MAFLEDLLNRVRARVVGNDWPPAALREHWERVELYRLRFQNDAGLLIPYNDAFSSASFERQRQHTPIPWTRELARFSAALLYSEPPDVVLEAYQDSIDDLLQANGGEAFWQECAETIAVEGRGALRIIFDDETDPDNPLITYVNEDKVIWDVRHGRFVKGGIVVIEAESDTGLDTYRMLEAHEPGFIRREVYVGKGHYLGRKVDVGSDSLPVELQGFEETEATGLSVPTLVRWDNVPGGRSDLYAIEVLLDRRDEAESLMLEKARKSRPWIFAARKLAKENGTVDISNLIFMQESEASKYLDDSKGAGRFVEHIQPDLQSAEHIAYLDHLDEQIITKAGYSPTSWGRGDTGSGLSGTALKLMQNRTLLTRSAKERMAREAMITAIAVALARKEGGSGISEYKPTIAFGDGLPRDEMELANIIATLKGAEAISKEEAVRTFHPEWEQNAIDEEVGRLTEAATPAASPIDEFRRARQERQQQNAQPGQPIQAPGQAPIPTGDDDAR